MANDPHPRIGREHALDAFGHGIGAIRHCYLPGVQRVADAHAAAIVNRNPRRARGGIQQGIEQGPIGHGVAAVFHALGFAERRRHRTAIQMIASDHDGRFEFSFFHPIVDGQPELGTFAVAQPADARRQPLKLDSFAGEIDPAPQNAILGKQLQHQLIGHGNIGGFPGQRHPAKRPAARAEQRADIGGHKSRNVIGGFYSTPESKGPDIVAVVKRHRAHLLQAQHGLDVPRHGIERLLLIRLRITLTQFEGRRQGHLVRQVAVQRVVRRSLVGEDVRHHAAFRQLGNDVGTVANQPDRNVFPFANRVFQDAECFLERGDHEVAIAGLQSLLDALWIDVNPEKRRAIHGGCQWLGSAHAAHAAADD